MKVVILQGESAGQLIELPADFARRLIILGQVARAPESSSGIAVAHNVYDVAALSQPEKR